MPDDVEYCPVLLNGSTILQATLYDNTTSGSIFKRANWRTFAPSIHSQAVLYSGQPEALAVEGSRSSFRARELMKTLESDLVVCGEDFQDLDDTGVVVVELEPADWTDISAQGIQFIEESTRKGLWGYEIAFPIEVADALRKLVDERLDFAHIEETQIESQRGDTSVFEPAPVQVREFCSAHGLNPALKECLDAVKAFFPNRKTLHLELAYFQDEEVPDIGHVVIRVEVGSDQETALRDEDAWDDWFIDNVSSRDRQFLILIVSRR